MRIIVIGQDDGVLPVFLGRSGCSGREVLENASKLTILIAVSRKFWTDRSAARRFAGKVAPTLAILLGVGAFVGACNFGPRGKALISDPDPANKIRAFKIAEENKDMTAVRQLAKDLE